MTKFGCAAVLIALVSFFLGTLFGVAVVKVAETRPSPESVDSIEAEQPRPRPLSDAPASKTPQPPIRPEVEFRDAASDERPAPPRTPVRRKTTRADLETPPPPPELPLDAVVRGRWLFEDTRLPASSELRTETAHWFTIYELRGDWFEVNQWPGDPPSSPRRLYKKGALLFERSQCDFDSMEILSDGRLRLVGLPTDPPETWVVLPPSK